MAEYLRRQRLRDMKYIVYDLGVMGSNHGQVELEVRSTSKLYVNKKSFNQMQDN